MDEKPIKLMSEAEIQEYYESRTFDFNSWKPGKAEISDPEGEFAEQTRRLTEKVEKISAMCEQYCQKEWDFHTDLVHDYFRNEHVLRNYYICKNKAFLKLCEILEILEFDGFRKNDFRSFHLCEGPGYFIEATYAAILRQNIPNATWHWSANTLNPYFENNGPLAKLVDDSHIRGHLDKWIFGPSEDGDVGKLTEEYLVEMGLAGTFDLVTADGSTDTQGMEDQLEDIVHPIIWAEIRAARTLLRRGGRMILKIYRFTNRETRKAIFWLADNFEKLKVFKPMTSRPGSSEKYLICDGFGGKCEINQQALIDCDEFFLEHQLARITMHLETFQNNILQKYKLEHKKQFLKLMRPQLFTKEHSNLRENLHKLFPIGHSEKPSPWMEMYGNNLVRRFQERDLSRAVDDFLNTANIFDPERYPLDIDSVAHQIMQQENLIVTSDIPLKVQDTLFIDAIAFDAMKNFQPEGMYYDLFESVSTHKTGTSWRDHFDCSTPNLVIKTDNDSVSIINILMALSEGFQMNMESFTIQGLTTKFPPLFLSRLSASMFALFYLLFRDFESGNGWIRWSGKKYPNYSSSIEPLLKRFQTEIPAKSSIRSFVPVNVLDAFHGHICYRNVINIMQARRIFKGIVM